MSSFWAASLPASLSMLSMARTISAFWSSSPPTKMSSCLMTSLICAWLPRMALLSSVSIDLELGHAATVEQQRERAQHLLDLGVAAGAGERDVVAVAEAALGGRAVGAGQLDVLLAQQARSA